MDVFADCKFGINVYAYIHIVIYKILKTFQNFAPIELGIDLESDYIDIGLI